MFLFFFLNCFFFFVLKFVFFDFFFLNYCFIFLMVCFFESEFLRGLLAILGLTTVSLEVFLFFFLGPKKGQVQACVKRS